jgi:hypothetical protein
MKTIYILTEGDYSDYHIVGVYSTKELAEEAQSLYQYSRFEEYSLDYIPEHPPGMKAWFVRIDDGTLEFGLTHEVNAFDQKVPHEDEYNYHNGETGYFVYCWAVDKEHAEKIALDKYYQHQAQKTGVAV